MKYPVSETFLSIQGEGLHSGRKAFFARLYGCDVRCPWCDTKYAWNGGNFSELSSEEIAEVAGKSGAEIAVISGGEPCLFELSELVGELYARGIKAHLETSGTHAVLDGKRHSDVSKTFDFIAVSPKLFKECDKATLARADELKFIVSDLSELNAYSKIAADAKNAKAFWIHPEWSKVSDPKLLAGICDFVVSCGGLWRVGWQMHKNYFVR